MRYTKIVEMEKLYQQLSYVYNNLDSEFRPQVMAPDKKTIVLE
jgi:hypothetical protein